MSFFIRYCNPTGGLNWYQAERGPTGTFSDAQQFALQATADAFIADHKMCASSFSNAVNNILLTSGASFTIPDNVFTLTNIRCWGGGGGGCNGAAVNGRPGGGGGAVGLRNSLSVTPGTAEAYQIGAAGTNGIPGTNGTATFFRDATTVKGDFGVGGPDSDTLFGTGGLIANSVGTDRFSGGDGAPRSGANGGGGGSSAGTIANGVAGSGSSGGVGPTGSGGGGNAGAAGGAPGGGGGGGNGAANGGAGAAGQISFTYVIGV